MIDHWDNLDRSIEHGYGGLSLWEWTALPDSVSPRYRDYARAEASIGINGVSLTNVNANAKALTTEYVKKVAALAERVPSLRNSRLSHGALQRADRDRRPQDGRSARPGRSRVVEGEGRRDLRGDPRLRRLPRQGELRRTTRAAGLQALARRRREHARRRRRSARRHRDLARVRLQQRRADRSREAGVRRVHAARRTVPRQRADSGEERPARLSAARTVLAALRRDAEDAADHGIPDHQGIPRRGHASRLPRVAHVRGPLGGHVGARQGLDGRQRDRRVAARLQAHRHRGRRQHRHRSQLDGVALQSSELVRVRPSRVGSTAVTAPRSPRSGRGERSRTTRRWSRRSCT